MLHSGLVSVTFRELKPREIVDLVVKAGLRAIEWGGDVHVPHGDVRTAREVYRMTKDAGLDVAAYGSYYYVGCEDELSFEDVLNSASALCAPIIRVWAGKRGSQEADEAHWENIISESRRIAEMASTLNIRVCYEFHGNTLTDTNESALKLLKEVAHDGIGTYWQPPVGESCEYCLEGLNHVLPWLTNVHSYWWPDRQTQELLVGGEDCWRKYLASVASTGCDHTVLLEFVKDGRPETFLADAATLNKWIAECNQ